MAGQGGLEACQPQGSNKKGQVLQKVMESGHKCQRKNRHPDAERVITAREPSAVLRPYAKSVGETAAGNKAFPFKCQALLQPWPIQRDSSEKKTSTKKLMRYLLDKVYNVLFASGNRTPRWQFSAVSFEGLMRQLETASRKSFRTDSKQMLHFSGRCQANNCQSATTISASHPCLKADARKHQLLFVPMRSPWGSMKTSRCQCLLKQHVRHIPQWRCATPRHPRAANIAVPVRLRSRLCRLKLTATSSRHCMSLPLCSNCVLMFHECELVSHLLHCWTSHWWYFLHFVSKKHIKLNCMLYCLKFFCLQILRFSIAYFVFGHPQPGFKISWSNLWLRHFVAARPSLFGQTWLRHALEHAELSVAASNRSKWRKSMIFAVASPSTLPTHLGASDAEQTAAKRGGSNSCSSPNVQIALASKFLSKPVYCEWNLWKC